MTPPPAAYYEMLEARLPGHGEPIEQLQRRGILLDGSNGRHLLQIFTQTVVGPIFFEIIQRKGDEGFGTGISARCSKAWSVIRFVAAF